MKKKNFLVNVGIAATLLGSQTVAAGTVTEGFLPKGNITSELIQKNELLMVRTQSQQTDLKVAGHSSHASHGSHGSHGSHSSHSSGY